MQKKFLVIIMGQGPCNRVSLSQYHLCWNLFIFKILCKVTSALVRQQWFNQISARNYQKYINVRKLCIEIFDIYIHHYKNYRIAKEFITKDSWYIGCIPRLLPWTADIMKFSEDWKVTPFLACCIHSLTSSQSRWTKIQKRRCKRIKKISSRYKIRLNRVKYKEVQSPAFQARTHLQ